MNDALPIFDELDDARKSAELALVLLQLQPATVIEHQDSIRRRCHARHFPLGAECVDSYVTAWRATRRSDGSFSERAEDLMSLTNARLLAVIAEEGEGAA